MKFSQFDDVGTETVAVTVEHLWDRLYALFRSPASPSDAGHPVAAWRRPIAEAIAWARAAGAHELAVREMACQDADAYLAALADQGFARQGERIEYEAPVAELPTDAGTPLTWMPLAPLGPWGLPEAAQLLAAVGVGDPDVDPDEDALASLEGYLADPELTTGPNCVHIGHLAGEAVAIVIAQVNPDSGWSRITYMGLVPACRGRGLGAWVHRHGFAMLREQGGALYRGGTSLDNAVMRTLFERHGCREYRRVAEWSLRL